MTPAASAFAPSRRGASIGRVLLSPAQAYLNSPRPWTLLLFLPLLASPVIVVWAVVPAERAANFLNVAVPALLCFGLTVLWALLVFDVMRQNRPELARLVPGHAAALRRSLSASAVCACAAVAVGAAAFGFPVLPALATMALVFGIVAIAFRWPWASLAIPLLLWDGHWLPAAIAAPAEAVWVGYPGAMAVAAVALMLAALRAVVLTGSLYHHRFQSRLDLFMALARNRQPGNDGGAPGVFLWGWQQRLFQAAYHKRMLRLLASPCGSVLDRLALGLGAQADPTSLLLSLLLVYLVVAALAAIEFLLPPSPAREALFAGGLVGVMFVVMAVPLVTAIVMSRTRREQALLRLLPGAPQGAALNGWLARRFSTLLAVPIVANIVAIASLSALVRPPAGLEQLDDVLLCVMALSPLVVLMLWRDWSRLADSVATWQVMMFVGMFVFAAASYAWVDLVGGHWWSLLGVTAAILLVVGPWRWRQALRAPVAWPVGRAA